MHQSTPTIRHDPRFPYIRALMDAVPQAQGTVDTFIQHFWHYDHILQEAVPEDGRRTVKALYDPRHRDPLYHKFLPATLQERIAYEAAYAAIFGDAQFDRSVSFWDSYVRLYRGLRRATKMAVQSAQKEYQDPIVSRLLELRSGRTQDVTHAVLQHSPVEREIEWESAFSSASAATFLWITSEGIPGAALTRLYEIWQNVAPEQVDSDMGSIIIRFFLLDAIPQLATLYDVVDASAAPEAWIRPIRQADILHALSNRDRLIELTQVAIHHG